MLGSEHEHRRVRRPFRMGPVAYLTLLSIFLVVLSAAMGVNAESEDDSEHDYHNNEWTFLIISFVMTYGTASIIAGLFAMRFGQKRSKYIGGVMAVSGLIPWGFWIVFKFVMKASYPDDTVFGIIYWSTAPLLKPLMAVIGVMIGGGLALFMFLSIVVRS